MTSLNRVKSNVLIVDDDVATANLFQEIINNLDINIYLAHSGFDALKIAGKNELSVVLLDMKMPGMNGYEVLEKLRKMKEHELTPVIIISANYSDPEVIVEVIERGAIDFIPKPVNTKILHSKVKQFVKLDQYRRKIELLLNQLENSAVRVTESESRFKKIAYTANDSIIVINSAYRIKFWNRASKDIFGFSIHEIREGVIFEFIISDKFAERLKKKLDNILSSNSDIHQKTEEILVVNKLGYEFFVEMSFAVFKSRTGESNIVVVSRDISLRKKLEKNTLKTKELQEANKTMKEFVDNISHELRTPMNAIIGISKMLLKYDASSLSKRQLEGLGIISNNGEKLLELINDILDLSKLDSRKIEINEEAFSLEKLLSNIRSIILNLIGTKNIKFVIRKSKSVPDQIYSDQKKITQILLNLLGNSVKFTEQGKIVLSLHLRDKDLCFEVYDTGCGIPKDKIGVIFNRFNQLDNSNKKKHQGTGLGLHIVKKMVQLFNGTINIESIPERETTISFTIKLSKHIIDKESGPREQLVLNQNTEEPGIFSNLDTPLALIIDDNHNNVVFYSKWLMNAEYSVLCAEDGIDGFDKLETYRPDLVLLNMEVKKFSAYTILKNIQKEKCFAEIGVLAISDKMDIIRPEFLNSKLKFLREPISEKNLVEYVRSLPKEGPLSNTAVSVFENSTNNAHFTDLHSKYSFKPQTLEQSIYIYYRRRSEIVILNGIERGSNNYKLLKYLSNSTNESIYTPYIVYTDDNSLDFVTNSGAFKKCISISASTFKQAKSFNSLLITINKDLYNE